jgi:hypothetical protein
MGARVDDVQQIVNAEWFPQELCNTVMRGDFLDVCGGGDKNDRHVDSSSAQPVVHFAAIQARHAMVEEHEVVGLGLQFVQRFTTIGRFIHFPSQVVEEDTQQRTQISFVVGDEQSTATPLFDTV